MEDEKKELEECRKAIEKAKPSSEKCSRILNS